jgi:hypothetical protein
VPVAGSVDGEALCLEAARDERQDARLILDHQDTHRIRREA